MQSFQDTVLNVVLSPTLWLCVLLGLTYGVLFALWRGGGWRQLVRDVAIGITGFAAGQLLASFLRLSALRVGEVHFLWGSLTSVLFLLVGRRLLKPHATPGGTKSGLTKP